jgi:hypothetical protein
MDQSMYQLRQGSMTITKFKSKFDEYVAYFPWVESDRVEFFVKHLRDSIKYKVNPYAPSTLSDVVRLAINFELEACNWVEGGINRFGERPTGSSFYNQISKSTKFSKSAKLTQDGGKNIRASRLSEKEVEEHRKKNLYFTYHKIRHQSWECPIKKRHMAAIEVDEEEEDV